MKSGWQTSTLGDVLAVLKNGVNLLLMRPTASVTSSYLNHALKFLFQNGYWRGICKQSVNQASVNQQVISRVEISCQRKLAALDDLKKSLLHQAFSGNL